MKAPIKWIAIRSLVRESAPYVSKSIGVCMANGGTICKVRKSIICFAIISRSLDEVLGVYSEKSSLDSWKHLKFPNRNVTVKS